MIKKIFGMIKKIVLSVLFIFAYNKLAVSVGVIIPINVITTILVSLFGIPSIIMLVLFSLIYI